MEGLVLDAEIALCAGVLVFVAVSAGMALFWGVLVVEGGAGGGGGGGQCLMGLLY